MKSSKAMSMNEIRSRGFAALLRELGPEGYVRFLQQFSVGKGDFTKERQAWADDLSMADIKQRLSVRREKRMKRKGA